MYKMPKTKRGADRQYDSILRAYRRTYASGGMFGFDWPTFRLNAPDAFAHIREMQRAYENLPECAMIESGRGRLVR